MNFKEIFGEETAAKIEAVITAAKEKGYTFIADSIEKPEYIQKSKLDEVTGQKDQALTQVTELTQQINGLKKSANGNEELTKQLEKLQTQNQEWEGKYKNSVLDSAIKLAAVKSKAKDPADVLAFVDKSKIQVNGDGTISGLDEQLTNLSKSKAYLFEDTPAGSPGANPAGGSKPTGGKSYGESIAEYYAQTK